MTTYFINPLTGNDANDGLSWSTPWATVNYGAAVGKIAPGDTIRMAKSPDPVLIGSVDWKNYNYAFVLPDPTSIKLVPLAEPHVAWTASANVICTVDPVYGPASESFWKIEIGSAFTGGKAAYQALTATTNFSAYQQLSFRYKRSGINWSYTGQVRICLCSDTSGNTIIDSFVISNNIVNIKQGWTINKGAALGSSIRSIALYHEGSPITGGYVLEFCNFTACKAVGASDCITFSHLISKSSEAQGGDYDWHAIHSFLSTGEVFTCDPDTTDRYYPVDEVVETVNAYKRVAYQYDYYWYYHEPQVSGTEGNPITFSGGWNPASGEQDGTTVWRDMYRGFSIASKSYVVIADYFMLVNCASGVYLYNATFCSVSIQGLFCCYTALDFGTGCSFNTITVPLINTCVEAGYIQAGYFNTYVLGRIRGGSFALYNVHHCRFTIAVSLCQPILESSYRNLFYGTVMEAVSAGLRSNENRFYLDNLIGFSGYAITAYIKRSHYKNNSNVWGAQTGPMVRFGAIVFDKDTWGASTDAVPEFETSAVLRMDSHVRSNCDFRRKYESGGSWYMGVSPSRHFSMATAARFTVARVYVKAGIEVTASLWVYSYFTSGYNLSAALVCPRWQLSGMDADVVSSETEINRSMTWEKRTISFTPAESGVVECQIQIWTFPDNLNSSVVFRAFDCVQE
jgi:hypothetical protein